MMTIERILILVNLGLYIGFLTCSCDRYPAILNSKKLIYPQIVVHDGLLSKCRTILIEGDCMSNSERRVVQKIEIS